jgi:cob(I)alamin adenosyltransferase
MSNRLTRIYTRTGDDGTTGLADGTRVQKDHLRIEVLGCLDELSSQIGLVAAHLKGEPRGELSVIQHRLFDLGAEIAIPGTRRLGARDVAWLEQHLDAHNAGLPPLREFLLPGGGVAAAHCHLARALCRRCERRLVHLGREVELNPSTRQYLNRLSDLLFVLARVLVRQEGGEELLWEPRNGP